MNKRSGILLYGYFGARNLGDDLLLAITVKELRALMPGSQFYVRDHGDTASLLKLGSDIVSAGYETILSDQSRPRIIRLCSYLNAYRRTLVNCRWMIFAGGTLFHARGTLTSLLVQYLICLIARLSGVRIAALGVGVAELPSPIARWLLRRIIALSDEFLVRDEAALAQAHGSKARLTGDLVFSLGKLPNPPLNTHHKPRVGLTVYPNICLGGAGDALRAELAEAIRRLHAANIEVTFLVCQREGPTGGDAAVFAQIRTALGLAGGDIPAQQLSTEPAQIARELSKFDVLCGMRFHVLVLAAMLGRPFVGIAHDNKVSEICRHFAMPYTTQQDFKGGRFVDDIHTVRGRVPDERLVARCHDAALANFRILAMKISAP